MAVSTRLAILTLLLTSCSCLTFGVRYVGSGSRPIVHDIDYAVPEDSGPGNGLILRVHDLTCAPLYDGTCMVFVDDSDVVTRTSQNRWSTNPASLLGNLLSRDLVAEGSFEGVYRRAPLCGEDVILEGYVREFGARETSGRWDAVLEVEVILLESQDGMIIFQRPYRFTAPSDSAGGFQMLASDMSGLVQEFSDTLRADIRAECASIH
jgi:ABC-type uncharacterized transport system auxiliary subunit